jgi:hypothetical protein
METILKDKIARLESFYRYDAEEETVVEDMTWSANICLDNKDNLYFYSGRSSEIVIYDSSLREIERFLIDHEPTNLAYHNYHLVLTSRTEKTVKIYAREHGAAWRQCSHQIIPLTMPVVFNVDQNKACLVDFYDNTIYDLVEQGTSVFTAKILAKIVGEGFFDLVTSRPHFRRLTSHKGSLYTYYSGKLYRINPEDGQIVEHLNLPFPFQEVTGLGCVGDKLCIIDHKSNCLLICLLEGKGISMYKVIHFSRADGLAYRLCVSTMHAYVYFYRNNEDGVIRKIRV